MADLKRINDDLKISSSESFSWGRRTSEDSHMYSALVLWSPLHSLAPRSGFAFLQLIFLQNYVLLTPTLEW